MPDGGRASECRRTPGPEHDRSHITLSRCSALKPIAGGTPKRLPRSSGPMSATQGSRNELSAEPNTMRPGAPRRRCSGPAMPSGLVTAGTGDRPRQLPAAPVAALTATPWRPNSGAEQEPVPAGRSPAETPNRADHNEARHARPPIERAGAPPERRDTGYSWPPPQADRDRARALYREDFGGKTTADSAGPGRDRGTNVVGDKPAKSPGDTSGLPPTGADLLEMEDKDESRADKFRKKFYGEFDDVIDSAKDQVETVKDLLERPSPTGHPEVPVNSGPVFGPEIPQHATVDPSSITEMGMVLGVIGFQAGRWIHHKIEALRKE